MAAGEDELPTLTILVSRHPDVAKVQRLLANGGIVLLASNRGAVEAWFVELANSSDDGSNRLVFEFAELTVDLVSRTASCRGLQLALSRTELDLLAVLIREPGRAWAFSDLLRSVWHEEPLGDIEKVRCAIKRLRGKLATVCGRIEIVSIRGVGIRLQAHDQDLIRT
jgi:DNA-binding response OmpR family regulator